MQQYVALREKIFSMQPGEFDAIAWAVYQFQYQHNPIYRKFVDTLGHYPEMGKVEDIPFLPVEMFKYHKVLCSPLHADRYFESSGTTGSINSRHHVADIGIYEQAFTKGFMEFYGQPENWVILALLPSYLERPNASLVHMVKHLMQLSGQPENESFLHNYAALKERLLAALGNGKRVLLIGVTFALLEFATQYPGRYEGLTIIETGGMKGRGKELIRQELHQILQRRLQPDAIHSEYGMTELFSQAYSQNDGIFRCISTMKVLRRDVYDPLKVTHQPGRGLVNVIDLANLQSCSFIATQDVCRLHADGGFEILGRSDSSDIRGCNLMMEV